MSMLRCLAAFAVGLSLLAAPALAAAPKPAPKAPAAKAAPAKPAAGRFDAQDPASLVSLLSEMGAKAEISRTADEEVYLKVMTPAFGFNVQFSGCNKAAKACRAVAFATVAEQRKATLVQLNSFNQTSLTCRVYQDQAGKPHVMYAAILSPQDTREEMRTHVGAWQGCLASFGSFLNDPPGYLAAAP